MAEQAADQTLNISINDSFLCASFNDQFQLSVRLVPRDYPPYQSVIPEATSATMIVSRKDLINTIKRVKVLSDEKSNSIKFSISENLLVVSANHPLLGEAKEKLDVNYAGNYMNIGFNARYMVDSLSVLDSDEIIFEFTNELGAVLVKSSEYPEFLGIIMPLKL